MDFLLQHHWPGNVRELENLIERAVVICQEPQLSLQHFIRLSQRREDKLLREAQAQDLTEEEVTRRYACMMLDGAGRNKKEACCILGITFRTLQRKLEEE